MFMLMLMLMDVDVDVDVDVAAHSRVSVSCVLCRCICVCRCDLRISFAHGTYGTETVQSHRQGGRDSRIGEGHVAGMCMCMCMCMLPCDRTCVESCDVMCMYHRCHQVGGSGCGKSTIVALLERFYDPLEVSTHMAHHTMNTHMHARHTMHQHMQHMHLHVYCVAHVLICHAAGCDLGGWT